MCIFSVPLHPKEILVVAPLLFLGYLLFFGIWFLAKHLDSPDNFPFIRLVLTILVGALYIIGFVKIIIHIRKKN
jgi:hypothetical protein